MFAELMVRSASVTASKTFYGPSNVSLQSQINENNTVISDVDVPVALP